MCKNIEVNSRRLEARPGETILSALTRAGLGVPTLCYMEGLTPTGACRLCVVEVEGQRNLVPSCAYPVAEGMKTLREDAAAKVIAGLTTIAEVLRVTQEESG